MTSHFIVTSEFIHWVDFMWIVWFWTTLTKVVQRGTHSDLLFSVITVSPKVYSKADHRISKFRFTTKSFRNGDFRKAQKSWRDLIANSNFGVPSAALMLLFPAATCQVIGIFHSKSAILRSRFKRSSRSWLEIAWSKRNMNFDSNAEISKTDLLISEKSAWERRSRPSLQYADKSFWWVQK